MSNNPSPQEGDNALQSILNLDRHLRQNVVLWFFNMLLALIVLIYGFYKADTVVSADRTRDYAAVNPNDQLHKRRHPNAAIERTYPLSSEQELGLEAWLEESLVECLTFDYRNYADVSNYCIANIMSLNRVPDTNARRGQLFYRRLARSGIIPTLLENQTSMTVSIESLTPKNKGLESYSTIVRNAKGEYEDVTQSIYVYEYEIVMRIHMTGQRLDAPIRYQVILERMNPLVREIAVGIRSVVSLD